MSTPQRIEPVWLVGFVGHRPAEHPGRSQESLAESMNQVEAHLVELKRRCNAQGGHLEIVTSLSCGADLMLLKSVRNLDIPAHLVLPYSPTELLEDFDQEHDRAYAQSLIEHMNADESGMTLRVVDGREDRPGCYQNVNYEVIRASDALLVIWDEQPARGPGGTGDAVDVAEAIGVPVLIVNPNKLDQEITHRPDPWPPSAPVIHRLNNELDKLDHDELDHDKNDTTAYQWIQYKFDQIADSSGKQFRTKNNTAILLHFFAAMIAVLVVAFTPVAYANSGMDLDHADPFKIHLLPKVLTGVELILVVIAAALVVQVHNKKIHRSWRDCRTASELLRGLLSTRHISDPIRPIASSYGNEWHRLCVSAGIHIARETSCTEIESLRTRYLTDRIAQQQLHFSSRLSELGRLDRALTAIGWLSVSTAPAVIGIALLLKVIDPKGAIENWWSPWIVSFLPIALPVIAGTVATLMSVLDLKRRGDRHAQVAERLAVHESVIRTRQTKSAFKAEVEEVERLLLSELWEWSSVSKHIGH